MICNLTYLAGEMLSKVFRDFLQTVRTLPQIGLRKQTPINFLDFNRNVPVSSVFGLDRGTPIDRYYIQQFLQENSNLIQGTVLEMADSYYSKRYGGRKVERVEVLHVTPNNPKATIIGDLTDNSTLPENKVDCFICTQTFNFIFEVQKAIEGAHNLLKPGGALLSSVSGIIQISRYDMDRWGDYWRFTNASVQKLFEPVFSEFEVKTWGNVLAATSLLQGVCVEDIPDKTLLNEHDPDYQTLITIVAKKASTNKC